MRHARLQKLQMLRLKIALLFISYSMVLGHIMDVAAATLRIYLTFPVHVFDCLYAYTYKGTTHHFSRRLSRSLSETKSLYFVTKTSHVFRMRSIRTHPSYIAVKYNAKNL